MASNLNIPHFVLLITPLLGPAIAMRMSPSLNETFQHILIISIAAFFVTVWLIPIIARYTVKNGMFGMDINKKGTPGGEIKIPESLGIACGIVYLTGGVIGQFWYANDDKKLLEYNASLLCICFMILLGFVDDALDIPWRYKLILPTIASLPLLIAYNGVTFVKLPQYVVSLFPNILSTELELGPIYYIYMLLVLVFCCNAINIHAGLNGLEVGQSYIIGVAIMIHNIIEAGQDAIGRPQHVLSLFLVGPFIGTSIGLLCHNFYPSTVFVGDTYTMFAGICLAVCGIMGHFSKTLMLFFIPQILNFLYSVPQLFGLFGYKCPRHRLPTYNTNDKLLYGVNGYLNLVNLTLHICGPMTERNLCIMQLVFQSFCCLLGLYIRYNLSALLY
eukprot:547854_1